MTQERDAEDTIPAWADEEETPIDPADISEGDEDDQRDVGVGTDEV